jgi:hypothetical protein
MENWEARYPDISDILARKALGRRYYASLSFGEKLDMLDALRSRIEPIIRAREIRRASHHRREQHSELLSAPTFRPRND